MKVSELRVALEAAADNATVLFRDVEGYYGDVCTVESSSALKGVVLLSLGPSRYGEWRNSEPS